MTGDPPTPMVDMTKRPLDADLGPRSPMWCLLLVAGLALPAAACVVVPAPAPGPAIAAAPQSAPPAAPYCREYSQSVIIAGQSREAFGTTCQQADGTWRIASPDAPRPPRGTIVHPIAPAYPRGPYVVVPIGPATDPSADLKK